MAKYSNPPSGRWRGWKRCLRDMRRPKAVCAWTRKKVVSRNGRYCTQTLPGIIRRKWVAVNMLTKTITAASPLNGISWLTLLSILRSRLLRRTGA